MESGKEKRSSKFPIAAACVVIILLLILTATTAYSLMKCSQLETRLETLENFIQSRIRESVSGRADFSETEPNELIRKRRDTTNQLADLSLHELLSLRGAPGRDGRDGKDGSDGHDGPKGSDGADGADGRDGADGTDGRDGRDGDDGEDGLDGRDGADGQNGADGQSGADGRDGVDGKDGLDGASGENCDCSALLSSSTTASVVGSSVNSLADRLTNIRNSISELQSQVQSSVRSSSTNAVQGGSTYIRWGRTSCGNNSQLLYEGFAAGSHYNQEGGSSEYACLPRDPEYNQWTTSNTLAWIYGAEYESSTFGIFPNEAHNKNVPCARCYTPHRSETIMISAKRNCPDTWIKEYEGYLMTGHSGHKHTYSYACVDASPEYVIGSSPSTDGALFYFVQTSCSSTHHCPPYIQGRQLTCVVCSK